jgi:hypothetical protein
MGVPGTWQGVSGLKWDFGAGEDTFEAEGGSFPISEGYTGPLPDVPQPDSFFTVEDNTETEILPFGLRIYGVPLSSVPEPASYGLMGMITIASVAFLRRRRLLKSDRRGPIVVVS